MARIVSLSMARDAPAPVRLVEVGNATREDAQACYQARIEACRRSAWAKVALSLDGALAEQWDSGAEAPGEST